MATQVGLFHCHIVLYCIVLYCIVLIRPFLAHLVLTHEYRYPITTSQWQDWCPLTIIILTLFNPVNEDFPPYALTLPRHCCTILPKALYPRLQQWQGLSRVEESQDTSRHSRDMPVKPPRSEGDSQTAYIPMDFFPSVTGREPVWKRYVGSSPDA